MLPGDDGSRLPWKSLIASSWTWVLLSLFFGPLAAVATGTSSRLARTAASSVSRLITAGFLPDLPLRTPKAGGKSVASVRDSTAHFRRLHAPISDSLRLCLGPVVTGADVHGERRIERVGAAHLLPHQLL